MTLDHLNSMSLCELSDIVQIVTDEYLAMERRKVDGKVIEQKRLELYMLHKVITDKRDALSNIVPSINPKI